MYDLLGDPRVTRTLMRERPATLQEEEEWCKESVSLPRQRSNEPPFYAFTIEQPHSSIAVGGLGLHQRAHPQQLEVGYWLGVPYWGYGLATDAVRLAVHFAFRHLDAIRVSAYVFYGNTGSRRVLEKNHFHLDGALRCHVQKRGEWKDEWFFTLLRSEWEAQKAWYHPKEERVVPAP